MTGSVRTAVLGVLASIIVAVPCSEATAATTAQSGAMPDESYLKLMKFKERHENTIRYVRWLEKRIWRQHKMIKRMASSRATSSSSTGSASSSEPSTSTAPSDSPSSSISAGSTYDAICSTFGSYCGQAWSVAICESTANDPTPYPDHGVYAANGQYLGLFQMGSSERATYGHGSDAWSQARAAYRYFAASGYDWSPWECKP
jgi:hypothetical protein